MKTTIAAVIALAACVGAAALAADTATSAAANTFTAKTPGVGGFVNSWYGPGSDGGFGYFNPAFSGQYNPYPYYNIVGGQAYGPLYVPSLPDQNESPFNPAAALTRHRVGGVRLYPHRNYINDAEKPALAAPVQKARNGASSAAASDSPTLLQTP